MKQTIRVIEPKYTHNMVTLKHAYEFRRDLRYRWVQKICFWVLQKIGAYCQEDTVDVTYHDINTTDVLERLYRNIDIAYEYNHVDPEHIIMGSQDFHELMGIPGSHSHFQFDAQYGRSKRLLGIRVHVVPWIRGMIVVPNLDKL